MKRNVIIIFGFVLHSVACSKGIATPHDSSDIELTLNFQKEKESLTLTLTNKSFNEILVSEEYYAMKGGSHFRTLSYFNEPDESSTVFPVRLRKLKSNEAVTKNLVAPQDVDSVFIEVSYFTKLENCSEKLFEDITQVVVSSMCFFEDASNVRKKSKGINLKH